MTDSEIDIINLISDTITEMRHLHQSLTVLTSCVEDLNNRLLKLERHVVSRDFEARHDGS